MSETYTCHVCGVHGVAYIGCERPDCLFQTPPIPAPSGEPPESDWRTLDPHSMKGQSHE